MLRSQLMMVMHQLVSSVVVSHLSEAPPRFILEVVSPNFPHQEHHIVRRISKDPLAKIAHISYTRDVRALPVTEFLDAQAPQLYFLLNLIWLGVLSKWIIQEQLQSSMPFYLLNQITATMTQMWFLL